MKTTTLKKIQQNWLNESTIDWRLSELNSNFYQAQVDIGNGIELCVEVGGNPSNPPLLLIMGLGSQMIFWPDNFINGLIDAGFFVIRFDNRDSGLSSKVKFKHVTKPSVFNMMVRMQVGLSNKNIAVAYNLVDMAEDVKRLIEVLGLDRRAHKATLMGASMGGIIAQIVASKYPTFIDKLVLLFSTTNRPMLLPPKPAQFQALFKSPKSLKMEDVVNHSLWFVNTVGTPGHVDEIKVKEIAELRYRRCSNPIGTVQQLHAILFTGSIRKYSKKIIVPTLVFHGQRDGLIPHQNGRDVARTIPNAEFDLIAGMGHDIPKYYHNYLINKIATHCL